MRRGETGQRGAFIEQKKKSAGVEKEKKKYYA